MNSINTALENVAFSPFVDIDRMITEANVANFSPLHQGKTTFKPPFRLQDWCAGEFDILAYQHASPLGTNSLIDAIVSFQKEHFRRDIANEQVIITNGGTHALNVVLHGILEPGDEVIILSPQWLFACGIVRATGGSPVEVPIFIELSKDPEFDFIAKIKKSVTPKTRAIYFNSPNNPTGFSFRPDQLECLAEFARESGIWIISDNAYELYDFSKHGFLSISNFNAAEEITFDLHSFSKTFAMPGYRIGYVIGPSLMVRRLKKWGLHSVYSVATVSQWAAVQALHDFKNIKNYRRQEVMLARDLVHKHLKIPHTKIEGGLYTFLDLAKWRLGSTDQFISQCILNGVSLAPGEAFGSACQKFARLCYTAVTLEKLLTALDTLNSVYETD